MIQVDVPALIFELKNVDRKHFIDGIWQPSISGENIETRNPATNQVLARLARGRADDVHRAVDSARDAFNSSWSEWNTVERQELFHRILQVIMENFEELAFLETLDMGAPITRTRSLAVFVKKVLLYYSSQVHSGRGDTLPNSLPGNIRTMTSKEPIGVIGGIIPWNAPLVSLWWIVAPAIASGCTVVLKPAEDASLTVLRVAELMVKAGLPPGVVNVVTGFGHEAGAALASSTKVDRLAFTGSNSTGREIIKSSASNMKKVQLELGGKSPNIVFADADLGKAVPGSAMAIFNNSGQICYAGSRLLVQRNIMDRFVDELTRFSADLRIGNGADEEAQLGPVVSDRQMTRVLEYIEGAKREGAKLVLGGNRSSGALSEGFFIEPTIFTDVDSSMQIAKEEVFGPVVAVMPFETQEEALNLANDTDYGLGAAVWTRDFSTAARMSSGLCAGTVWVNCYGLIDPAVGFGGIKHSGYGMKGGPTHLLDMFYYTKSLYFDTG